MKKSSKMRSRYAGYLAFIFFLSARIVIPQTFNDKSSNNNIPSMGVISVTIGGEFIVNGSFPAYINERVDQFVTRLFNEAKQEALSTTDDPEMKLKIKEELEKYSIRDITLKRSNGEELKLDLLKFRMTGDFLNNPYLKNDDVLIFPPSDLERNFFSIMGAVNKPGKYHFREGDKLSDAIELAQGINKAYENVTKAEINRLSYDGETMEVMPVDVNSDYSLQRGDRIVVIANETQKKEFSITVVGEVKSPGKIPITKNTTTLRQVIEKAGGLTEKASLKLAKIYTGNTLPIIFESLYNLNLKDLDENLIVDTTQFFLNLKESILYRMSNVNYEEREYFRLENQLLNLLEVGSIDFSQIQNENSEAAKYIVKDGDFIFIPAKQNTVYVFGQVIKPGHIIYKDDMDYNYYIKQAGGLGEYAQDEDEIMVIKGDSHEWISPIEKKVALEAGDFIYVPREAVFPFSWYVAQFENYFSIVASAATIIILLLQLNPNNR